jgi:hypothetical protein
MATMEDTEERRATEDEAAVQGSIKQGDFTIEWERGKPNVHFWSGEPFSDIVKTISLRHLLLSELQAAVPLEFFGNPMDFVAPKDWVHAEQVSLLQALLRAYDQWERRARR